MPGDGQLTGDRDAGRTGADHGDLRIARRDRGHVVGDARGLVPLGQEALHCADRERPVDVAAPAGAFTRRRAYVRTHRGHRIRFAREDVALFETALSGEVQVPATVRAHGARFLALDVALEPGGVDRLNQKFLVGIDGQKGSDLVGPQAVLGCHREGS